MKKLFIFLLALIGITFTLSAQVTNFYISKDFRNNSTKDSQAVIRITPEQLDSIILNNQKVVIQFFQPWCGGVNYWIDRLDSLHKMLAEKNIPFFLIMDTRQENKYFLNKGKDVGMVVYYFTKYKIQFPTYIIGTNQKINTYRKEIEKVVGSKISKNNFGFYIKNGKILCQEGSYNFYDKIFKIIQNE